jgi:hypothetical protein
VCVAAARPGWAPYYSSPGGQQPCLQHADHLFARVRGKLAPAHLHVVQSEQERKGISVTEPVPIISRTAAGVNTNVGKSQSLSRF